MVKGTSEASVHKYRRTRSRDDSQNNGTVEDGGSFHVGPFRSLSRRTMTDDLEKITSKRVGFSYTDIDSQKMKDVSWKKEEGVPVSEMVLMEDKDRKKPKRKN